MKIGKSDLDYIKKELEEGKTFSEIGKRYGVKAWTIQKRLKTYHPTSSSNFFPIWEEVEDYQDLCFKLQKKYWQHDIIDFLLDKSINLNKKNINYLKNKNNFKNKNHKKNWFKKFLENKIFTNFLKKKKTSNLFIDNNSGFYAA